MGKTEWIWNLCWQIWWLDWCRGRKKTEGINCKARLLTKASVWMQVPAISTVVLGSKRELDPDCWLRLEHAMCLAHCIAIAEHDTWWLVNSRHFSLTVLEARSLRPWCQHGRGKALLESKASLCILTSWNSLGSSLEPFYEALVPLVRVSSHNLISSWRPDLLILSHSALGFQRVNFGGTPTFRW